MIPEHLHTAKTAFILAIGALWGAGSWATSQLVDADAGIGAFLLSAIAGSGVTLGGIYFWVRFVSKNYNRIIEQQGKTIDRQAARITQLEALLDHRK